MTRRVLVTIVVIVTGLLLQSTVFAQLRLLGVSPELMFLITIVVAILEGPQEGAITGFAAGLAQDFLLDQPKGVTALTLTHDSPRRTARCRCARGCEAPCRRGS